MYTDGYDQSSIESHGIESINRLNDKQRKKKRRRKYSKGEKLFPKVDLQRGIQPKPDDYQLSLNPEFKRTKVATKRFSN